MIRLRFVREADPVSSLIAYYSASPFSHVGVLLPDGSELGARSDSVGGKPPGVQIRPGDYAKFAIEVVFAVPCTDAQEGAFLDFCHKQIGKKYDKIGILGFASGRNWRDETKWFCSELVTRAGEVSTILPYLYISYYKITPGASAIAYSAIGAKW